MKLSYYAVFEYDNDDICISFPDLPPALTCADNETDGKKYAKEAMDLALDGMCADEAPSPSSAAQITLNENQKLFLITTELEVKMASSSVRMLLSLMTIIPLIGIAS